MNHPPPRNAAASRRRDSLARAAQHDILRRLTPPLRHDLVVHLQSVGMMAEAIRARLDRGRLAGDELHDSIAKMNRLSRQAVQASLDVAGWMRAGEEDTMTVQAGLQECVRLLATTLNFRGFALRADTPDGDFEVSRGPLRFLLAAAVLTLADTAGETGEILLRAEFAASQGLVTAEVVPAEEPGPPALHEPEVPLNWEEIQALAAESTVDLQRRGNTILLRFPRAQVTKPVAMAPV